ncbi:MAG: AAA family ATPase [Alphaproteobacteria bacterium]|nr:AAA family ATPase [Alphaproteobacteria bacterium]
MSDLTQWLASRNLGSIEEALVENEIDFDLLFDLTDEDMREIGLSLGARKRLRAAIDDKAAAPAPSPGEEAKPSGGEAERRHLTTMFVDLVGSTALSAQLDPEDMRNVITSYQNAVAGVVTRYEGHVAKYMGDGVLCYFGWPTAHEDDAKRAARSGLEIVRTMKGMLAPEGQELTVRVGVATGVVVVGDLIGEGAAQEQAVVGDTPNLAARLQGIAEPGQVIVAAATRQLLGHDFDINSLGEVELKGMSDPLPAWQVVAERSLESRFEQHAQDPVLPMVGRDHELALVMDRWQRACGSEGQVTILTGEAGIGKSRLMRAVLDEIQPTDHYRISYYCSPYHTDSSFYPVIQQLTDAFGLAEAGDDGEKLDKLEAGLLAGDPRIMAELMQFEVAGRYAPLELTPQQVRNRILEEMAREVRALAREKPVLVVVEDAHWIDASTLAILEACLDSITGERALILITARPTFSHGFGGHPIVSKLALNRLGADQTANVLAKITGGKSLPKDLVTEIITRTDGVPLFIEELTKTIIESGELRETDTAYELIAPISRMAIPSTLHDSLMARIDRLQPIKEVAQMAACIGRTFERAALMKISRLDDQTMDDALAQLERSELVFRRGSPAEASYVFKHALVRDVAYESLLRQRRQEIHHRLVDVFEADPATPPEITAHHATEAGLTEKALLLWGQAGAQAQARPAYVEASNHLRMALSLIEALSDQQEWSEKELALLVQLAQIHIAKDGYASSEASDAFAKALDRIDATSDAELRIAIYYGTWIAPYIGNQLYRAYELVERLVKETEREPDPIPRLISLRMRAATLIAMGRSPEAREDLEAAYVLYQSAQIEDFSAKFAQDPGVQIWCYMLLAKWQCGDQEGAQDVADRALTRARELKHANTLCYAGLHDVCMSILTGNVERARAITNEMREVASDHDMALWKLYVGIQDVVIACMADEPDAPEALEPVLAEYKKSGCWLWITVYLAEQAKALLRAGDVDAAEASLQRAFSEAEITGEIWALAELNRINGEICLHRKDPVGAGKAFNTAISVAHSQGATILEERAARALSQLNAT